MRVAHNLCALGIDITYLLETYVLDLHANIFEDYIDVYANLFKPLSRIKNK